MSRERTFYKGAVRPLLFGLDPEAAHNGIRAILSVAERSRPVREILTRVFAFEDQSLQVELWGETFKNPVGLAAGFDKNAEIVLAMSCLGFSHIEIGAVTNLPQEGNPKPRIFRLVEEEAAINQMGMNNLGVERISVNLERSLGHQDIPIGVNIASSTGARDPITDYLMTFEKVYPLADYFVLNISCPNIKGHRGQQERNFFSRLADRVVRARQTLSEIHSYRPLLVKISPDLNWGEIDDILDIAQNTKLDGIIATNTTLKRDGLTSRFQAEVGGLSGRPLKQRSTEVIAYIHQRLPELPIIGVGGVETAEDAWEKLQAGANLVQLFTGMIYEGPFIVKNIKRNLVDLMRREEG